MVRFQISGEILTNEWLIGLIWDTDLYTIPYTKMNFTWIKDLSPVLKSWKY